VVLEKSKHASHDTLSQIQENRFMSSNPPSLDRRSLMLGSAAAAVGMLASHTAAQMAPSPNPRRRSLRIAHLTDVHVQPERSGGQGFAAALQHVQSVARPDLILFGGDNVMAVDTESGSQPDRARAQLDLWTSVLAAECSTPHRICIGNHDVLAMHPVEGKAWACDAFGLDRRYHRFDQSGWRFIVLDSTFPIDDGSHRYTARLDDEQFDWLSSELASAAPGMPVFVLSHIPIVCACAMFDGENEKTGDWHIPGAWMHTDARRIKDLFWKHKNVKVAASGHIHLADRVDYLGTTYLCNGAVSAGWWKGPCQEFDNGYGVIDLFDDGTSEASYETFGWKNA
jgi:hypothetical protein